MRRFTPPCQAREIPGENDDDRATRIWRETKQRPALTWQSARDDMREAGLRLT